MLSYLFLQLCCPPPLLLQLPTHLIKLVLHGCSQLLGVALDLPQRLAMLLLQLLVLFYNINTMYLVSVVWYRWSTPRDATFASIQILNVLKFKIFDK